MIENRMGKNMKKEMQTGFILASGSIQKVHVGIRCMLRASCGLDM